MNKYRIQRKIKKNSKMTDEQKKLKLLEIAIDTRKFEIEMYWKRATYFWAFIAASFTAFFIVLNSSTTKQNKEILIVLSLIGFLFSFGWYLVNRGSKFWQENWESHVVANENAVLGEELFNKVINPNSVKWYRLHEGYPISVSKINQIISLSIFFIWIYLFLYSLGFYYEMSLNNPCFNTFKRISSPLYFLFVLGFSIFQFLKNAESKLSKDYKKKVSSQSLENHFISLHDLYKK
jgi:hypothetical protein